MKYEQMLSFYYTLDNSIWEMVVLLYTLNISVNIHNNF